MINNMMFRKAMLTSVGLLLIGAAVANSEFSGKYEVSAYDKDAGDASIQFSYPSAAENSTYSATLTYSPSTLADFFGGEPYKETISGAFNAGAYAPAHHRQTFSDSAKQVKTDFTEGMIYYSEGDKEVREFSVENPVYDTLSLILQVREDIKNNQVKPVYYWMTEDNIRGYNAEFSAEGDTRQVTLTQQNSGKRVITIVFDSAYNLQLFHKVKSGKVQFSLAKI